MGYLNRATALGRSSIHGFGGGLGVIVSTVCCARATHSQEGLSGQLWCHTIVGPSVPMACSCGSVVTLCSSCRHTCSGGSAYVLMPNRLTGNRWSRVSLGRSWCGCSQMGSTTDHPMTAMTSSMAVVTCMALLH